VLNCFRCWLLNSCAFPTDPGVAPPGPSNYQAAKSLYLKLKTRAGRISPEETRFNAAYALFEILLADADLTERRRRVFACRWADLHNGAGIDSKWSPVLRGRRPDYGLGNEMPALFLELKDEEGYARFKSA